MKTEWLVAVVILSMVETAGALDTGGSPPSPVVERALVDPAMVQQAIDIEKRISAQAGLDAPSTEMPVVVLKGSGNIIVTAPHATQPYREGTYRFSDGGGTAALAIQLNRLGCATVIYTQYRTPSDPNYYDDNDFKRQLSGLIDLHKPALVLDIHGSHDARPYDVDVGTMNGAALLDNDRLLPDLFASLREEGIANFSNNYFAAEKNQTIARFASAKGVPSIQLEISSTWLRPSENGLMAHRYAQLLQGLARYVRKVSNNPSGVCGAAAQTPSGLAEPVLPG